MLLIVVAEAANAENAADVAAETNWNKYCATEVWSW